MSEALSLSIFTIEADRTPLLAFASRKHQEADDFCGDERVPAKPLRVRLAKADERARYYDQAISRSSMENLSTVFLVDVDDEAISV
jgi:hypothetical protein